MSARTLPGDLISTRPKKGQTVHPVKFVVLKDHMDHYEQAVDWLFEILKNYKDYTREIIHEALESRAGGIYIGLLGEVPMAMIGVRDKPLDPFLEPLMPPTKWVYAAYVDKRLRGMSIFRELTKQVAGLVLADGATRVMFDSIVPHNTALYKRKGASVISGADVSYLAMDLLEQFELSPEESQFLICLAACQRYPHRDATMLEQFERQFFETPVADKPSVVESLIAKKLIKPNAEFVDLTEIGLPVSVNLLMTFMPTWYSKILTVCAVSEAYAAVCSEVQGLAIGQFGPMTAMQYGVLLGALVTRGAKSVLDVGSGNGALVSQLFETGHFESMLGIDSAAGAVEYARGRGLPPTDVSFETSRMSQFETHQRFDAVVSVDSIYFTRDRKAVVEQYLQLLKPGGALYLFVGGSGTFFEGFAAMLHTVSSKVTAIDCTSEYVGYWARVAESLTGKEAAFEAEGNAFLYRAWNEEAQRHGANPEPVNRALFIVEPEGPAVSGV